MMQHLPGDEQRRVERGLVEHPALQPRQPLDPNLGPEIATTEPQRVGGFGDRSEAVERGVAIPDRRSVAFGQSFLNSVSRFGRVFEFGSVVNYKIRTGDLFSDIDKALSMATKGKLSLIPKKSGGTAEVQEVFLRSEEEEKRR